MVERLTRVVSATQSGQGNGQIYRLATRRALSDTDVALNP